MSSLSVCEIFRSIQGESSFAGLPCTFIRLAGCPLRCAWCDTAYARAPGREMTVEETVHAARALGYDLVELTGGEPLAQQNAMLLLKELVRRCDTVLLETSGALPLDGVPAEVRIIMDIKPPGSGQAYRNLPENIGKLKAVDEVKFVVADLQDFAFACLVTKQLRLLNKVAWVHVAPVKGRLSLPELARWVLDSGVPFRLQPQLHALIWPGEPRGR